MEVDDDQLARLSRKGEAHALATLYRRHAPSLLDYLTRITGERTDAEDIVHETFLRVFQGRGRYKGRGRFRTWLFTIATRIARDRQRRERRHGELKIEARETITPARPMDPSRFTEDREMAATIDSALTDLPQSYAIAFHLRIREEMSYREIAAISGESMGTLRSRVHHALKRLRQSLVNAGVHRLENRNGKDLSS